MNGERLKIVFIRWNCLLGSSLPRRMQDGILAYFEPLSKSSSLAPAVADDAFSMLSVEGGVTFRGILPGAQVEVFTPGGMILLSRVATASDLTVQLPLRGVYYVRVNGLTRAFVY